MVWLLDLGRRGVSSSWSRAFRLIETQHGARGGKVQTKNRLSLRDTQRAVAVPCLVRCFWRYSHGATRWFSAITHRPVP
jgi:hypothetical protein